MKELSIEEKAKAYDEVRKKIAIRFGSNVAEEIFSQFEMSEDERIRKDIITYLSTVEDKELIPYESWIAWLEKQGEKPNNVYDKELSEILGHVICRYINDSNISYTEREKVSMKIIPYVERLEKQDEQKPNLVLDIEIPFGAKDSELQEASYHIPEGFHAEIEDNRVVIKRGEQNPAWSEEDEDMINETLYFINEYQKSNRCKDENGMQNSVTCENWLITLKDKFVSKPKQEWSEEDEYVYNEILKRVADKKLYEHDLEYIYNWLKSLRPQNWTKEDKE